MEIENMMQIIKKLLLVLVERIDAGNSNLTEEEALEAIETLNRLTARDEGMSKYSACKYLNVSRATFDNLVREGKIPRGKHHQGFKELRWFKKDLEVVRNRR